MHHSLLFVFEPKISSYSTTLRADQHNLKKCILILSWHLLSNYALGIIHAVSLFKYVSEVQPQANISSV